MNQITAVGRLKVDQVLIWPILALLPLSALALGAVHPWAFSLLEAVVFATAALWLWSIAAGRRRMPIGVNSRAKLVCGLTLTLSLLIGFQLLPLPPACQRAIAPKTYQLHAQVLPGWPQDAAYGWVWKRQPPASGQRDLLPDEEELRQGARVPFTPASNSAGQPGLASGAWLPLSLAPSLTFVALLKLAACLAAGLLLMLYPLDEGEIFTASKRLVRVVLATGLIIGLVGLGQQVFSNARPLGVFSPYDWGAGLRPWGSRAYGPFANPDHFAGYLAMCWPFALAGLLFPSILGRVRERAAVPLLSGTVALVLLGALIASASRGGWLAAGVATFTLLWLARRLPRSQRPVLMRENQGRRWLVIASALALVLLGSLMFTSGSNRTEADARLADAFTNESLRERARPALQSLAMIRDFPIFGVGFGAWPELYRKYTAPPLVGTSS